MTTSTMNDSRIRISVRSLYDLQKLRIQNGNRIVAAFRYKLGLHSSQAEDSDENAQKALQLLRSEFKRITDGVKRITKTFQSDSQLITTRGELAILESYERSLEAEELHIKMIEEELEKHPLWTEYLKDVRGVGTLMAGVILSEIDITKCNSISALWAYAGLDVVIVEDAQGELVGQGRCKRATHLVPRSYVRKDGTVTETVGITYNPFLKTKMVGVLADVMIKLGGPYRVVYDGYKHRLENHPKHKDKTKAHRNRMAKRYMIKMFLADLWTNWRRLEGLPVRDSYAEGKLGIQHSQAA